MKTHRGKQDKHVNQESADVCEIRQRMNECLNQLFHAYQSISYQIGKGLLGTTLILLSGLNTLKILKAFSLTEPNTSSRIPDITTAESMMFQPLLKKESGCMIRPLATIFIDASIINIVVKPMLASSRS